MGTLLEEPPDDGRPDLTPEQIEQLQRELEVFANSHPGVTLLPPGSVVYSPVDWRTHGGWRVYNEPFGSGVAFLVIECSCGARLYDEGDEMGEDADGGRRIISDTEVYRMWDEHRNDVGKAAM